MGSTPARRVLVLGLLAGCLALLPFLRESLGAALWFLPVSLVLVAIFDLLTAGLLATRFLGLGSSQLLGLAGAYFGAGLLSVVHLLVLRSAFGDGPLIDAGPQAAAWLWAVWHGGLPLALAVALWGGPLEWRRRLAGPTARRTRAVAIAFSGVIVAVAAVTGVVLTVGSSLPTIVSGGRLSDVGLITAPVVLGLDLLALVIVARRGRRSAIERRLLIVVATTFAGTALTLAALSRYTVGWYAAGVLDLIGSGLLLSVVAGGLGRLGVLGVRADASAGERDPLTGVRTRAATLTAADHLASTRADGAPLGLALLDVDGLRRIADEHGPLAADAVLMTVARRLRGLLRDRDVLGRAGDEGFLLLLPDTDSEGVTLAVDRAVAAIREQKVGTWAYDVRTTASAGIAMVGVGDSAVSDGLAAADLALNQAKAHGRDQVVSPARALVVPLRRAGAGPPRG
ncbi:diguanylate cyclase domain-containing protein [Baekduia sp. Peel2402]|uniref:diguanylate cyclase domain-containing protein n=1 Tax=Baekduia sp. Peel2402 TaxID=3458296 RepID=UPI00403E46E7